jgi:hypothetical protein
MAFCRTAVTTSIAFFWVSVVGLRDDQTNISWLLMAGEWIERTENGVESSKLLKV